MHITESAIEAILQIMKSKNLDSEKVFFEMRAMPDQSIVIGFNREKLGNVMKFGNLQVIVSSNIDTEGVVVDYVENGDKKGLVFKGE